MSFWHWVTTAAIAAGGLAALVQLLRPRLGLLPLCWGSLASLLLVGTGRALGQARGLLEVAGRAHGPDAKAAILTTGIHLGALGPALMHTGIALCALALVSALAWWRTAAAGSTRAP